MRRLTKKMLVAGLALGLVTTGCNSGGGGSATGTTGAPATTAAPATTTTTIPTAEALITRSREAVGKAMSVRMVLIQGEENIDYAGDLDGTHVKMKMKMGDQEAELITVDGATYAKGNAAFYQSAGVDPTIPGDRWVKGVKVPIDSVRPLLNSLYDGVSTTQTVTTGTFDGKNVYQVKDSDGSIISIDPSTALPAGFEEVDGEKGKATFSDWDAVQKPTPPADAIDVTGAG